MSVRFGKIVSYDIGRGTGLANIVGESDQIPFSLGEFCLVVAGFSEPEFGLIADKDKKNMFLNLDRGDEIVARVFVSYDTEVTPYRRTIRRKVEIIGWSHECAWEDAWRIIKERPRFQAVKFTLYNGVPTSVDHQRVIVATGTAIQLQKSYPRGGPGDKLAPERNSAGFTYRVRFYPLDSDCTKTQVPDPRKLPLGQKEEKFQPTNEQGVLLATEDEIASLRVGKTSFRRELVSA